MPGPSEFVDLLLPPLSATMDRATVVRWLKAAGDSVRAGEAVLEVETDKAVMEVEAPVAGTLIETLVDAGDSVLLGAPLGRFAGGGKRLSNADDIDAPQTDAGPAVRILASPYARHLARERGVDLVDVARRVAGRRICEGDIVAFLQENRQQSGASQARAHPTPADIDSPLRPSSDATRTRTSTDGISQRPALPAFAHGARVPITPMRAAIARRVTSSKQSVPHFYLTTDVEIDALLEFRKLRTAAAPNADSSFTINDMLIRATANSLIRVPAMNVAWDNEAIRQFDSADIGIAVAVEGGLITPVVRRAHEKNLATISAEAKDLAERGRQRKLAPHEYEGGTFTVSNLGMYDLREFSAIIHPPQAGILAVGRGMVRPVARGREVAVATVMTLTLSIDHRVIDGATAAQFLSVLKGALENPSRLDADAP